MAEQGGGPDWLEKWQELQRGFWESLRELLARATPAAEDAVAARAGNGTLPWHEGLEIWCRLYQPQEELGATVERVLARSRAFLGLLQRLAERSAAGEASEPAAIAGLVQDLFRAALPDPAGWLAAWSADRLADLERGLQPVAALQSALWGSARGELERWLSIQPLGLLREHQERRQALGRAGLALGEAQARYQALIARAVRRGLERFEERLAERAENNNPVRSGRELFDLWVDAGEEGFAEIAALPEFREVYGALVNAQMRLRQLLQQEIELASRALGIPTRSELDGVLRKLKALGERLRAVEARLPPSVEGGGNGTAAAPAAAAKARRRAATTSRSARGRSARRRES